MVMNASWNVFDISPEENAKVNKHLACALILPSNCEAEMKEVCGEEHERHQPVIAKFN